MHYHESKDTMTTSLLSEVDMCICPIEEITESDTNHVTRLTDFKQVIGIQRKTSVHCNSDGSLFFFANNNFDIYVYKMEDNQFRLFRVLQGHCQPISQILYDEQLYYLFSCGGDGLYLWDLNKEEDPIHLLPHPISSICFLYHNSALLAGAVGGSIHVLDALHQFCELDCIPAHKAEVTQLLAISTRHLVVSSSRDATVQLWDTRSLHPSQSSSCPQLRHLSVLQGHQGDVMSLACTQDGSFIFSGGRDHSIRCWSVDTGKCVHAVEDTQSVLGKHRGEITSMDVLEMDRLLVSTSTDGTIKCFQLARFEEDPSEEPGMVFTSIDDLLTDLGKAEEVESYQPSDRIQWSFTAPCNGIVQMTHSADYSRFAISSLDRSVHVYSADPFTTAHFTLTHTFSSPAGTITGVVSDLQNALYSVSSDHHFLITSLEDGRVLEDRDCGFALSSIAWDYPLVCVAGVNYSILLFSQLYPSMICHLEGHVGKVTSLAINPSLHLVISGGMDSQILLHSIPSENLSTTIPPCASSSVHNGVVSCVTTSSSINGRFYAASGGSDYALVVYALGSSSIQVHKRITNAHDGNLTAVLFGCGTATGVLYSAGMDGCVKVWNCLTLKHIGDLLCHSKKVVAVAQSPDGRYLVSASADRSLFVYDSTKQYLLIYQFETKDEPSCLTFHHTTVVVGMVSGGCQLWNLPL